MKTPGKCPFLFALNSAHTILLCSGGLLQIHRADFQSALLAHLPNRPSNCRKHTAKRLVSYAQPPAAGSGASAPITLTFADGTIAACDVLLGADGIRSAVRAQMCRELGVGDGAPVFSGKVAFRCLVCVEQLRAASPTHPCLTAGVEVRARVWSLIACLTFYRACSS
jgi:salicylate hydroxylase